MGLRPRSSCRKLRLPAQGADWQLKGQEGGLAESYWFDTRGRKPGTSREQGDTEDFGGWGLY